MKNHKFIIIIALLAFVLQGLTPVQKVLADEIIPAEPKYSVFSLADINYKEDISLSGGNAITEIAFSLPESWVVGNPNGFNLQYNISDTVSEQSSATIEFNGTKISSFFPRSSNGSIMVTLDRNLFKPGRNAIRITTYLTITDRYDCADDKNPSLWMTVKANSAFQVQYAEAEVELNLAKYPSPFIEYSPIVDQKIIIVTTNSGNNSYLQSTAMVVAKLSALAGYAKNNTIEYVTVSDYCTNPASNTSNTIIIGTLQDVINNPCLPQLDFISANSNSVVLNNGNTINVTETDGILHLQRNPNNNFADVLYVSGLTDAGVIKSGMTLANELNYPLLSGNTAVVANPALPKAELNISTQQKFSLKQLGYQDYTVWGFLEGSLAYTFTLPDGWSAENGAFVNLNYSHSKSLNNRDAFVSVSVNQIPLATYQYSADEADIITKTIAIPMSVMKSGQNTLTITTSFDDNDASYCNNDNYKDVWTVVYADSEIYIPSTVSQNVISLKNYPASFIGMNSLEDTAFIIPANPSFETTRLFLGVIKTLALSTNSTYYHINLYSNIDTTFNPNAYKHLIVIGLPTNNTYIQALEALLPYPAVNGTDTFQTIPEVSKIETLGNNLGIVEFAVSQKTATALVFTGTTTEGLSYMSQNLNELNVLNPKCYGDVCIFSSAEDVTTRIVKSEENRYYQPDVLPVAVTDVPETFVNQRVTNFIAIAIGSVTLLVLIAVGLMILKKRKK